MQCLHYQSRDLKNVRWSTGTGSVFLIRSISDPGTLFIYTGTGIVDTQRLLCVAERYSTANIISLDPGTGTVGTLLLLIFPKYFWYHKLSRLTSSTYLYCMVLISTIPFIVNFPETH